MHHRLATIHERDQPTNDVTTPCVAICASYTERDLILMDNFGHLVYSYSA